MRKSILARMMTILIIMIISGCGKEKCPSEPSTDPSFSSDVQPILTAKCAIASCHDSFAQAGLDLSPGKSYDNLVGVSSVNNSSKILVIPNNADASYLYIKIVGQPADGTSRMPIGGNPLSNSEIQLIKSWIDKGAKNN